MHHSKSNFYMAAAWLLIAGCTVGRMVYAQSFPLTPDETNYWQWSRHLAWGYHDQTPMIAWAIYLFTWMLGHSELAVRLPSILSMAIASLYMVAMAKHWFSERIAWQTALFTQSIFIFNVGALLATADGLQGAGWAAASYYVARGFETHRWRHWIAGGLWFGFGLLSKYTMVLFLPFVFIFGLLHYRHRLTALRPYIGCAMGFALFIPVIVWNAENGWNSVRHVAYLGGANESFQLHFKYFAEFLGSQAGLLTPLAFAMVCAGWIWTIRRWKLHTRWIYHYLLWTSLPMILGFALLSLHTRVYGNWPCTGYLTACVLAAAVWSYPMDEEQALKKEKSRWLWRFTVISASFLTAVVLFHILVPILPIPAEKDRTLYEIRGWDDLGLQVLEVQQSMPDPSNTFLFGVRYQIASELAFYVPGQPYTVSINRWNRPNVYDYWWRDEDLTGKDAVGVLRDGDSRERLQEVFARVDLPKPFYLYPRKYNKRTDGASEPVKALYIYRCYGFKGGLRWIPPRPDDIRAVASFRP
jgi:undecaprenyl-diphosphatase